VVAATYVPIRGAVLAWAIDEAGVDEDDVAARLRIPRETVDAWIAGTKQPSKTQFKKLAQYLRRPTSFFFLRQPPTQTGVPAAFRHPPGAAGDRPLGRKESQAIRRARRTQTVARWLVEGEDIRKADVPAVAKGTSPTSAAAVVKEYLDWSLSDQFEAANPPELARVLRARLEERGLLVVHFSIGEEGCRGFSLNDELAPLIAINTHYSASARVFSYMHEFGHLLRRTDSICTYAFDSGFEKWCERFAGAFLLPTEPLTEYVLDTFGRDRISTVDEVARIARRFRVSLRATAYRLESLTLAASGLYERVDRAADFKTGGGGGGGETAPERRLREYGANYSRLLLRAEESGTLRTNDVLEYLNLARGQLEELRVLARES
jgi:Zn-dependent peptidase ImmA (M78 family)/transcriptional regulator with XRE-family HTH domain